MLENNENVYRAALVSQSPYTIPFTFWKPEDIQVWITQDGVDHQLSSLEYSISGDQMTLSESAYNQYLNAECVTIMRVVEPVQTTDYTNGTHIDAEVVERSLDKLTAITQQLMEAQKRSIKTSVSEDGSDVTLPSAEGRANSFLAFGPDGKTMEARSIEGLDESVASAKSSAQSALAAVGEAVNNANLSRQYAEGKKLAGTPVVPGEAGYQGNSKYWAEEASRIKPAINMNLLDYDAESNSYTLEFEVVYPTT